MNTLRSNTTIIVLLAAAGLLFGQQKQAAAPQLHSPADSAKTESPATPAAKVPPPAPAAQAAPVAAADSAAKRSDTLKKPEPVLLVKTSKDTVLLISNESEVQKILASVSSTVKKSRIQGYGGAGGFSYRMVAFDMSPVVDLAATDSKLAGIEFPTLKKGFEGFTMYGGLGYGGLGSGIRIGGGGYGGTCKYSSLPFKRTAGGPDSAISLKVNVSFGGLLLEKAMVSNNWNLYAGSFIGGGSVSIEKVTMPAGKTSAFSDVWFNANNGEQANASFMSMEFHGGATYTIVPWMHVGGDLNALFYYSNSGFEQSMSNSFYGMIPGFGIRIVFGNIG